MTEPINDIFGQEPWIRQILNDQAKCSTGDYQTAKKSLLETTDLAIFKHVLVVAIDRLDYETLYLQWLP